MNDPTAKIGIMAAEAIGMLVDAVERIRPESWDQPSNLDDWSLRDLVGHATGSAAKIDVQRSQGRLVELPEDLLTLCRGLVESVPEGMLRRPGGFGPARPAPPDATPTARLMAYLGRSVDAPG